MEANNNGIPGNNSQGQHDQWYASDHGPSLSEALEHRARNLDNVDSEHEIDHSRNSSAGSPPQTGATSSIKGSRTNSGEIKPPKEKHRVRFNSLSAGNLPAVAGPSSTPHKRSRSGTGFVKPHGFDGTASISSSNLQSHIQSNSPSHTPVKSGKAVTSPLSPVTDSSADIAGPSTLGISPQRAMFSLGPDDSDDLDEEQENDADSSGEIVGSREEKATHTAFKNAVRLSESLKPKAHSAPQSKVPSPRSSAPPSPTTSHRPTDIPEDLTDLIPLEVLNSRRKKYGIEDESDDDDNDNENGNGDEDEDLAHHKPRGVSRIAESAQRLIHTHARNAHGYFHWRRRSDSGLSSGQATPGSDLDPTPPSDNPRGVLSSLLKLYGLSSVGAAVDHQIHNAPGLRRYKDNNESGTTTPIAGQIAASPAHSPSSSGHVTPKRKIPNWRDKSSINEQSSTSLTSLVSAANVLTRPGLPGPSTVPNPLPHRPRSTGTIDTIKSLGKKKQKDKNRDHTIFIRDHVEDLLARQHYIIQSCRALMRYGAPTHRLEEYMRKQSRVLQVQGQFLYIPGCMIMSFDDPDTHTTEVKLVRENQGIDLGRLLNMHDIYKAVVHDKMGPREASEALDELWRKKPRYNAWWCVLFYGFASAMVGPFAFGARPIDLPIIFCLGVLLGFLQLICAPKSELFSNVFEIFAAVLTSFAARAFGSINGGNLFCFSALAQSSIALILPGYIVLSAALELQSRNIVAGSVRMVYAVIYSLFLGFGITIGTSLFGAMAGSKATSDAQCRTEYFTGYWKFIFVPPFTMCLILINQGKWRQAPAMLIIAFAGYIVNYFSALRFASNVQISNTFGAFTIGVLGNLYSRFFQGMSAAALLPAIFVQVPSGIAASGSLVSGITSADQIVNNSPGANPNNITTVANGTQAGAGGIQVNAVIFNVAYTMIQVAVGLTVGLFSSALLVYYSGGTKKKSGLFSF